MSVEYDGGENEEGNPINDDVNPLDVLPPLGQSLIMPLLILQVLLDELSVEEEVVVGELEKTQIEGNFVPLVVDVLEQHPEFHCQNNGGSVDVHFLLLEEPFEDLLPALLIIVLEGDGDGEEVVRDLDSGRYRQH